MEPIETIMTPKVVTVEMDDTLATIRNIFTRVRFHHLLVVENQKLVGIISDRDFFKAISPYLGTMSETTHDQATLEKRAHQIMARRPVSIGPQASIEEASRMILDKRVSCLPVTTGKGEIVGILTWRDLLRALCARALEGPNDEDSPSSVDPSVAG